jgi:hypothetical protein
MISKKGYPILAMLGLLASAYGFDRAIAALQDLFNHTFLYNAAYSVAILIELIFAGMVILLAWLVLVKYKKSALVGWVFVVIGLLAFFLSTPYSIYLHSFFNVGIPPYKIKDFPFFVKNYYFFLGSFSSFLRSFTFFRFFTKASALIIVLGLANLLRKPI